MYQIPGATGVGGQGGLSRPLSGARSPSCSGKVPCGPQHRSQELGHVVRAETEMSEEQEGREEHWSPAGSLDLCAWAAGSQPAIPFISGSACLLENLYQLCYINRNTGNWARNAKITQNPKS